MDHLYVSVWYIGAAFVWFPILFGIANIPSIHFGVEHALVNWWFAHNVLGLWFTPMALAAMAASSLSVTLWTVGLGRGATSRDTA